MEQAYKSFQADYTRKTQEVAPFRKLAEEVGGDVDALRASVEFAQNLQTDPQFALEVHAELSQALEQAGLTKAEADAEASRQVVEAASDGAMADEFDSDDPRDRAIQELMSFKDELEAREQERMLEAEITRQEMAIRQNNPEFTDDDMNAIVEMSFAHGGNLFAAEKAYKDLQQRFLSSYINRKESVSTRTPTDPAPNSSGQQPRTFEGLDDAHKAAMRHLRETLGG